MSDLLEKAIENYDNVMMPVYLAIDSAVRSGYADLESIQEGIDRHLEFWADELYYSNNKEDATI